MAMCSSTSSPWASRKRPLAKKRINTVQETDTLNLERVTPYPVRVKDPLMRAQKDQVFIGLMVPEPRMNGMQNALMPAALRHDDRNDPQSVSEVTWVTDQR